VGSVGIREIERRLERLVEGTFARIFKTGLGPVEVARRITREMDVNRNVGVSGAAVVPNHFEVQLSEADHRRFAEVQSTLVDELVETAEAHAVAEGYVFLGPVEVHLGLSPKLATGSFACTSTLREAPKPVPRGVLVVPSGDEIVLGDDVLTVGRMHDCAVVIADPNISRHHAEVHPDGDGWMLVDLGSTNGSRVNGKRVDRHHLVVGDVLSFGTVDVYYDEL
jgi:hypothetical protein